MPELPTSPITVGVVDDQPLLVSAFVALIDNQPDLHVVGTAADGEQAVTLAARVRPDVLLMDLRMPVLDGVEATRRIARAAPRPRILVLTTFNVDELVTGAIGAGARGFLLKDADPGVVLDGIRAVHRGEAVLDPAVTGHVVAALQQAPPPAAAELAGRLTARETEVLALVARGASNAEIAAELFIAETTVKTHIGNLLLKLAARDRVALVVLAHTMGLARPGTLPSLPRDGDPPSA